MDELEDWDEEDPENMERFHEAVCKATHAAFCRARDLGHWPMIIRDGRIVKVGPNNEEMFIKYAEPNVPVTKGSKINLKNDTGSSIKP